MRHVPEALRTIAGKDIVVFDGVCVLCSGFMRFVCRHDQRGRFHFVIAQSDLGEALYAHYGLKCGDYETNLVFLDGVLHLKLDAFTAVMAGLGWPWRALVLLNWIPRPRRDALYDRLARNRYRLFGRRAQCMVPDAELKARFLG